MPFVNNNNNNNMQPKSLIIYRIFPEQIPAFLESVQAEPFAGFLSICGTLLLSGSLPYLHLKSFHQNLFIFDFNEILFCYFLFFRPSGKDCSKKPSVFP